jgi:hypothetical protein
MKKLLVAMALGGLALIVVGVAGGHGGRQTARPPSTEATDAPIEQPSTTVPTTSTSTTVAAFPAGVAKTDSLERTQPLMHVLPHETLHYKIDYRVLPDGNHLALTVTLNAVLNRADQVATYQAQLKAYKAEALDFLRSQGQDPAAYQITYDPAEAASL